MRSTINNMRSGHRLQYRAFGEVCALYSYLMTTIPDLYSKLSQLSSSAKVKTQLEKYFLSIRESQLIAGRFVWTVIDAIFARNNKGDKFFMSLSNLSSKRLLNLQLI